MNWFVGKRRGLLVVSLPLVVGVALTGCQTVGYYAQAVRGHCQVLARRQSCEKLIADPATPAELKAKLRLAEEIRQYARRELNLPVNGDYQRYADVGRRFVVWNVTASPEFSLEAKTWWYPMVGSLDYRGYFTEPSAQRYAARLAQRAFDTHVAGVEAYSTLGWFRDPLLNTFLHHPEAALAEILFHELAHQRVFAGGDTDFNEAFATVVGQEGARRWLRSKGDAELVEAYAASLKRNEQFVRLVAKARNQLAVIYGDEYTPHGTFKASKRPPAIPREALQQGKRRIQDELRAQYHELKAAWGGYDDYDEWFSGSLNNAQLNSVATYYDLVPAFERLLAARNGDLEQFYAEAGKLAKLRKAERHRRLLAE
jgi:predicted aminopeptidase